VVFSAHDAVGDDLRRRWDDPDLELVGESPVVHAGLGSHSGAYLPGDYLVTFDPSGVAGVLRLARKLARVFLPWTRGEQSQGVGIPYVDYHRGDGQSIGPGQPRQWTPVLVDDHTPWIRDYRGLWGNDTADPFGGERGPAGPRYERSTLVRSSWGNPVGWAGLDKVPPSPAHADALLAARIQQLDAGGRGSPGVPGPPAGLAAGRHPRRHTGVGRRRGGGAGHRNPAHRGGRRADGPGGQPA
jgi:hypothetical protein